MKLLIVFLLSVTFSFIGRAQTIKNEGAKVIVDDGTFIKFENLHNSGANARFYYNSDISVPGDWTNLSPAVFEQGANGSISFNGSTTQTIASGGSSFGDLSINNTSGDAAAIVLSDDMSVSVDLNLTNGIINTGVNKIVFENGSTTDVGNTLSFVDGKMEKTGAVAFTFPTGDVVTRDIGAGSADYRIWSPIGSNPSAATTVDVEYIFDNSLMPDWWEHSGNMDATIHHVSDREYWLVSSTENFTDVTLYWNDNAHASPAGLCVHGFDFGDEADFDPADLVVSYWDGSKWVDADFNSDPLLTDIAHDQGFITSRFAVPFGAKSQKIITYGSKNNENPLPVELVSLAADCSGKQVDVIWQTASEINNAGFVIEKSYDATTFSQIGFVQGAGNSNRPLTYVFSDLNPLNGNNYYRLKQMDNDGKFSYSTVVLASCNNDNKPEPSFIVYPNPSNDFVNVSAENMPGESSIISVYNVLGSMVYQKKESNVLGNVFARFDLSDLPPAMYMVKIISGDYVGTKKVEKQ